MDWEQHLADEGYRITAPRRAMIHVLQQTTTPLSPQEILQQAQSLHRSLGLVTVYRMLNLLVEEHLVRRVHREAGCHGYLPASPGHHHAVICIHCGKAEEFSGDNDMDGLVARVEAKTGYYVQDHLLQLSGLCPRCRGDSG